MSTPGARCIEENCRRLSEVRSRCAPHFKLHEAERKQFGFAKQVREPLPKNWASLRRQVLTRDRGVCYICGRTGADSVDHLKPRAKGGTNELSNLKAAHWNTPPYCHRTKSSHEGAQFALEAFKKRRGEEKKRGGAQLSKGGGSKTPVLRKKIGRQYFNPVMQAHGGICGICKQKGADSICLIEENTPTLTKNLMPIHRLLPPHCWNTEI